MFNQARHTDAGWQLLAKLSRRASGVPKLPRVMKRLYRSIVLSQRTLSGSCAEPRKWDDWAWTSEKPDGSSRERSNGWGTPDGARGRTRSPGGMRQTVSEQTMPNATSRVHVEAEAGGD